MVLLNNFNKYTGSEEDTPSLVAFAGKVAITGILLGLSLIVATSVRDDLFRRRAEVRVFADLNGDIKKELIIGSYVGNNYILTSQFQDEYGIYGKQKMIKRFIGLEISNLKIVDIDGDGLADLVYTEAKYNETLQKRCVYTIMEKNKGGGTFAEPKIIGYIDRE